VTTHDKREPLMNWRNAIACAAQEAADGEFFHRDVPVRVSIIFRLPRPASTPKRVTQQVKKPDLDKLTRAVLDGLKAVAYEDDSQVVLIHAQKGFARNESGALIWVEECKE
jgi:Holliday junction resolvase RusA-like endonuclease